MAITAADFNGDGIPDLAVVNSGTTRFLSCWALETELAMVSVAFLTASCGGGSSTLPPPQVITGTPLAPIPWFSTLPVGGQEHAVNLTLNVA